MTAVPHSPQPAGNDYAEPPCQFYQHALRHRRDTLPDVSEAGLLTHAMRAYLKDVPGVTVEAVTAQLLAYAVRGLEAAAAEKATAQTVLAGLTVGGAKRLLGVCERASEARILRTRQALMKQPDDGRRREKWLAARSPEVIARLTGTFRTQPWDAAQDGHLLTREAARAAGIVRWAHAETAERRGRVSEALAKTLGFGPAPHRIWSDRRPIVVIDRLTVYTVKLVTDAWSYDPAVAVIYTGGVLESNPFDAWDVPVICDTRGWLRALLAVETVPCVIEPRLGGFTVTAATGLVDPAGLGKGVKMPAWLRTLAEIGLLAGYDRAASNREAPAVTGPSAERWYERYRALLGITLACDHEARRGRHVSVRQLEALSAQRHKYVELRDEVVRLLHQLAEAGRGEAETPFVRPRHLLHRPNRENAA